MRKFPSAGFYDKLHYSLHNKYSISEARLYSQYCRIKNYLLKKSPYPPL
jgi:hypothetical protein